MKTQMWSWWKSTSLVVMSVLTIAAFTACGNKGKGGGVAAPIYPGAYPGSIACTNCPAGSSYLVPAVGQTYGATNMQMVFDLYAAQAYNGNVQNPYTGGQMSNPYINYAGPVIAQGVLYLNTPILSCSIPAGGYQLQTAQPGVFGSDGAGRSVDQLYLQGAGPVPLLIYVSGYISPSVPAATAQDGRTFPYRMKAYVQLKRQDNTMICDYYLE